MELHAGISAEAAASARLAGEIRAELARQKRTAGEAAAVLGITAQTMGRRLNGASPFNVVELDVLARWLGVDAATLMKRAEGAAREVVAS